MPQQHFKQSALGAFIQSNLRARGYGGPPTGTLFAGTGTAAISNDGGFTWATLAGFTRPTMFYRDRAIRNGFYTDPPTPYQDVNSVAMSGAFVDGRQGTTMHFTNSIKLVNNTTDLRYTNNGGASWSTIAMPLSFEGYGTGNGSDISTCLSFTRLNGTYYLLIYIRTGIHRRWYWSATSDGITFISGRCFAFSDDAASRGTAWAANGFLYSWTREAGGTSRLRVTDPSNLDIATQLTSVSGSTPLSSNSLYHAVIGEASSVVIGGNSVGRFAVSYEKFTNPSVASILTIAGYDSAMIGVNNILYVRSTTNGCIYRSFPSDYADVQKISTTTFSALGFISQVNQYEF